jgi:DeoR/GlpR family transcriptional regulator of sugar metabolism
MLGGEVRTENRATLGRDATDMLSHYFTDFAVIGAGAISPTGWLMDYTREEAELHGLMLRAARTVTVVADHDKFGRFAPVRVDSLERATYLVTDRVPEPALGEVLAALPIEVMVSDGGEG